MPTGVVIGAFRATPFVRIDSIDAVGHGCAVLVHHVDAGLLDVPVELDAGRVEHARVASASSGPIPSPGIRVTRWAIGAALYRRG